MNNQCKCMYLYVRICDNVCQVWPWKAKRAWRWTGGVKWLSSCPHKPLCSGTYNNNNLLNDLNVLQVLKKDNFKEHLVRNFRVLWHGIFLYCTLENSWNYFTSSRTGCTCSGTWSILARKMGRGCQILHLTMDSFFR